MAVLDSRWHVPADYSPDLDMGAHVLRQRGTPTTPALNMTSYAALEEQLETLGPASLLAWQLLADEDEDVAATIEEWIQDPMADRLWCAHVMQVIGDASRRGELAKLAWQAPLPTEADKFAAGLMIATSVAPDKARQFLPKIETGLATASIGQQAVYALVRAGIDPEVAIDDAFTKFETIDDHFGLAQCALVAYQRELASGKDPARLRGYLEHAVYRYDLGRRESWAARLITYGLLPLLQEPLHAPDDELLKWLERAAMFATGARSFPELAGVIRLARKLGFETRVTTLEAGDPPSFVRVGPPLRQSQPVIAAATAATPVAEAPKGKKRKKKT